jgi:hypothetical protein
LVGVTTENVLDIYSALLQFSVPRALEQQFWEVIINGAKGVLESPSFLTADLRIIKSLLSSDYFVVSEQDMWKRCHELGEEKLQELIPYFRYALMPVDYFVDNVMTHLTREDSESILVERLLGKPSRFTSHIKVMCEYTLYEVVNASDGLEAAKSLAGGTADWSERSKLPQWLEMRFRIPVKIQEIFLVRVCFTLHVSRSIGITTLTASKNFPFLQTKRENTYKLFGCQKKQKRNRSSLSRLTTLAILGSLQCMVLMGATLR